LEERRLLTAGAWAATGSLNTVRDDDTATLLNNGQVLVAGGDGNSGYLSSAELYNPATGIWTATGSLNTARDDDTATLLNSGQVLVAGGRGPSGLLASAELYNPATGIWTATGSLNTARYEDTATLLNNGQVLVAGGYGNSVLASAELYSEPLFISSLSPPSAVTGTASFTLTVNGSDFQSDSAVEWNGAPLTTTYVSAYQLLATVPAGDLAVPYGSASITVLNPTTDAGTSPAAVFYLDAPGATAPTLTNPTSTSITLATATLGGTVTADNGAIIQKRGILYAPTSTDPNPTLGDGKAIEVDDPAVGNGMAGTLVSPFADSISGLNFNTSYSFVAFATNDIGTSYTSPVAVFNTLPPNVVGWGLDTSGQLGNSGTTNQSTPAVVQITGATGVASSSLNTLLLNADGTVSVTGSNANGQLGNGTTGGAVRTVPGVVPGLSGVVAVATGTQFGLALKSDGTVWAWGLGTSGQLGNGTTTSSNVPVQVSGLTGVTAIAAGGAFGLALEPDGTVRAWGLGTSGQLGNGTTTNSNVPVQVSGLTGVTAIASGSLSTSSFAVEGNTSVSTTTAVASSSSGTSIYGTSDTFTATVTVTSGGAAVTSGSVQFYADGNALGSPVAVSGSGLATSPAISTLQVTGSAHAITADYLGATGFATSNGTLAGGQTITPLTLAVTGITASNKPYDGTTTATAQLILGLAGLSGVISPDNVFLVTTGAAGTFDFADVNTASTVTISGLALGGSQASDYQLPTIEDTTPASITQAPLTVSGITANNKPYDGTLAATLNITAASLNGLATGDSGVTLDVSGATGTFASAGVANNIAVQIANIIFGGMTQDGTAASVDYTLPQPATTANITSLVSNVGSTVNYTVGGPAVALAGSATVSDPSSLANSKLVVTIGNSGTYDVATIAAGNGVTINNSALRYGGQVIGYFAPSSGATPLVVQFTGLATTAAVQAVIDDVVFSNTYRGASVYDRTASLQLTDQNSVVVGSVTTTIHFVAAAPTVGNLGPTTNYTPGSGGTVVAGSATVSGQNDLENSKLVVSISNAGTTDALLISPGNGITLAGSSTAGIFQVLYNGVIVGWYQPGSGSTPLVVQFNSAATVAAVQAVTDDIAYCNTNSAMSVYDRTVSFTLTDGLGTTSTPASKTIHVT
jgi:hypothetical protein